MRNPLIKRIPKELKTDWHKYLVIIIFMVIMIGVISGMYVGHDSMLNAIDEGRKNLNLEDGCFEIVNPATQDRLNELASNENIPVAIYEHFYIDESEDYNKDGVNDGTIRIYKSDSEIDKASFNSGHAPKNENEIAIDRMHADNVGVGIGDSIYVGGTEYKIVGLLSYVNYLTLHESNTDLMFDAFGFDVAMMIPEAFDKLDARIHYNYAFEFEEEIKGKVDVARACDSFLEELIPWTYSSGLELVSYLPEYLNQAVNFAPSDIEGDSAGTSILCYILIAVIAFIFAVTINNTIDKEASVIGTLRAMGYSRGELIFHYMSIPFIVTIIGAVIGNILGYTTFRSLAVNLYYNSYSLPKCNIIWSQNALIKTTVIPFILMFTINLAVIVNKLRISPLRFLRHDLSRKKRTKARRIPRISFLGRFRIRILFQNIPNYLILIFGVVFIELMMCFAFGLPDSLVEYGKKAPDMMFAKYQYILMETAATSEESAEKFSVTSLLYPKNNNALFEGRGSGGDEKIKLYGIVNDSDYIKLPQNISEEEVYISTAFRDKFKLKKGDYIKLNEEFKTESYKFKVAGFVDYDGGIAAFMSNDTFNAVFGRSDDEFSGYFSENEIADISASKVATVITSEDIEKVTVQLMHSMGRFIEIFKYALIVLAAALIYLLAKIIIEKNEHAISMVKILGFKNSEISSLYMLPTALLVVFFTLISVVIGYYLMVWIFYIFILQMDGYFGFYIKPVSLVLAVLYLLAGYGFVTIIDYHRIKKIPLSVALKNMD